MRRSRRAVLQALAAGPALGAVPAADSTAPAAGIYERLGVRPILNFRGTYTALGASKIVPDLHQAMAAASQQYVSLEELQDRVGEKLAALAGTPAAMVTSGAAGAITLGTCACLTGEDWARVTRLPDVAGMKSEVLIQKVHRNAFDHAVRNTGVRLVEVETLDGIRGALSERTAMMFYLGGQSGDWVWPDPLPVADCHAILRQASVPLMVDAANMLPPWDNVRRLAAMGVELICLSGGKHMRGPQCSGILAGRADLIRAARLNSSPNEDALGRPMKVGREEIVGVWLAAERYAKLDFAALDRACQRQAEFLREELGRIQGLRTKFSPFDRTRRVHRVIVEWDEGALGITAAECEQKLLEGEPRIALLRSQPQGLLFTLFMNDEGDEIAAARRMREIFHTAPGKAG